MFWRRGAANNWCVMQCVCMLRGKGEGYAKRKEKKKCARNKKETKNVYVFKKKVKK